MTRTQKFLIVGAGTLVALVAYSQACAAAFDRPTSLAASFLGGMVLGAVAVFAGIVWADA